MSEPFDDKRLNKERRAFFSGLRTAWSALVFDRYEVDSQVASGAGWFLANHYRTTGDQSIKLSNPEQVKMLDALAEAAEIPHRPGRAEIPIPEHAKHYTKWMMTAEYEALWNAAKERRR